MPSHQTTFIYQGKEIPLSISPHYVNQYPGLSSKYTFGVIINKLFAGYIRRNVEGIWEPLDKEANHKNLPFPLEYKHYQRLGEIIEREFGEWV